jgi:hypothetical protein
MQNDVTTPLHRIHISIPTAATKEQMISALSIEFTRIRRELLALSIVVNEDEKGGPYTLVLWKFGVEMD